MKCITVQVSQLWSVYILVKKSRSHTIEHNLRRTYATRLIERIRPILMLNHTQQMASSRKYETVILQVTVSNRLVSDWNNLFGEN